MDIHMANFTYAKDALTVTAGRQGLVSPLTDNGNAADGVVATYKLGDVTLAGAYFNNQPGTVTGAVAADVYGAGIIASVADVNLQAWYLKTADDSEVVANTVVDNHAKKGFALLADTTIGDFALSALYADTKTTLSTDVESDQSFLNLGVSTTLSAVSVSLNYVKTGDEAATVATSTSYGLAGGNTTFDNDTDAAVNAGAQTIDLMNYTDAQAFLISISGEVAPKTTLKLDHINGDEDLTNKDLIETRLNC